MTNEEVEEFKNEYLENIEDKIGYPVYSTDIIEEEFKEYDNADEMLSCVSDELIDIGREGLTKESLSELVTYLQNISKQL